jgi:DNA replication protein DnaC
MSAKAQPTLQLDGLREQLNWLGLSHAALALEDCLSEAVKHNRAGHEIVQRLLDTEVRQRDERRIRTALKLSNLPANMTLGNFDYAFQPGIDKRQIETLATCAFVREHSNILLQGPPGVGKTHLAVALGVKAIEQGFGVVFYRLEDLLHDMRKDAHTPPTRLRRKKYFSVSYLVVDEVGFEAMSASDASLFFRLISYRYGRGSTAITTNKSIKDWPGIFAGDEAMTAAILDRLLHKCVALNIRGRSYRLQDLERMLK